MDPILSARILKGKKARLKFESAIERRSKTFHVNAKTSFPTHRI
jgi:hypothetical protein